MQTLNSIPALDEPLGEWREAIGADFDAYRNHIYRTLHYYRYLAEPSAQELRQAAIAGCFHDLGIWSDNTFDYLEPSDARAQDYLEKKGLQAWSEAVREMIVRHHKLRAYHGNRQVEAFRRADLVDVSLGLIRFGIPRSYIKQVKAAFPNCGFHKRLIVFTLKHGLRHPLNPMPMLRW